MTSLSESKKPPVRVAKTLPGVIDAARHPYLNLLFEDGLTPEGKSVSNQKWSVLHLCGL